ncbi:MAG: glycosyltransferase [Parcubacteria group bacterium]|nr:glycosyltransferase [Parcubacteria group bacterium]
MRLSAKPTILFFHSSADLYGSDRALLALVAGLRTVVKPVVVLPEEGSLVRELTRLKIKVRILPISVIRRKDLSPLGMIRYLLRFIPSVKAVRRLMDELAPTLVYTNTAVLLPPALAARLAKIPHIWHVSELLPWGRSLFTKLWLTYIALFATRIVAISRAVKAQFPNFANVTVIPDGIALTPFLKIKRPRLAEPVYKIGMVGRINALKGQSTFIKAASLLLKEYPLLRFEIVGDTYRGQHKYRKRLERLIEKLGIGARVHCIGFRSHIAKVLTSFDLFVMPSESEGLGLAAIEALASGLPVVASRVGGLTELITDRENGLLVPPKDPPALAHALKMLIDHPVLRRKFSECGRASAQERFSNRRMVREHIDLYEAILSEKSPFPLIELAPSSLKKPI